MNNITISLLTLISLSATLWADGTTVTNVEAKYTNSKSVQAEENLKQSINLGFSSTTGNTKTLNVNGRYDLSFITTGYNANPLKVALDSSAFFSKNNDVKSNEEYTANIGLEQNIIDEWLIYTGVNWLRNPEFRNYDNKYAVNIGLGKELYHDEKQTLTAKLGMAYNVEDYAHDQDTEQFGSLNEYLEYHNKLNKVSSFHFNIGAMENFDDISNDYEVTAVIGVNFLVGENINLSIDEELAYDHLPALGFKTTDTKSIVRLGYTF
jgi:putative salt-induced outer membrane protein YdiY